MCMARYFIINLKLCKSIDNNINKNVCSSKTVQFKYVQTWIMDIYLRHLFIVHVVFHKIWLHMHLYIFCRVEWEDDLTWKCKHLRLLLFAYIYANVYLAAFQNGENLWMNHKCTTHPLGNRLPDRKLINDSNLFNWLMIRTIYTLVQLIFFILV